jgi:HAD superfamily hydrolase (TIGR01509 family)
MSTPAPDARRAAAPSAAAIDGVIFDCDGVLVDSEPIANRVLVEVLGEHGLEMTVEESMRTFVGRSWRSCLEIIAQRLGHEPAPTLTTAFRTRLRAAFERELRPVDGIVDALDRIALPVCVASSGEPEKIRHSLGLVGLRDRFGDALFSASEVARGKPAPDLFLHAAARMGFAPERTVVVEDSVPGVEAGIAAGMVTVAYAGDGGADRLRAAGAHVILADLRALPDLLGRLSAGARGRSTPGGRALRAPARRSAP